MTCLIMLSVKLFSGHGRKTPAGHRTVVRASKNEREDRNEIRKSQTGRSLFTSSSKNFH